MSGSLSTVRTDGCFLACGHGGREASVDHLQNTVAVLKNIVIVGHHDDRDVLVRSTGLSLESNRKLTEIAVIDVGNMTDAIHKFRYFEKKSIEALVGADGEG